MLFVKLTKLHPRDTGSRKMSVDMSADELRILIAQAQALLENAEYLQGTTPPKTRRDSDTNQEGMRARAHDLQSSSPVTPTAAADDDVWIWVPWGTRKRGVSSLTHLQSLRVDGIVAEHEDLRVRALACRDSAHAEDNASSTELLDTQGEHPDLKRHLAMQLGRLGRVSSSPHLCRKDYT